MLILVIILGLVSIYIARIITTPRAPRPVVPEAKTLEKYGNNFLSCTLPIPEEKKFDFLFWLLKYHNEYGKWFDIDLSPDGDLFAYCFNNDEALEEGRRAAGYRFPVVECYPVDSEDGKGFLAERTKKTFEALREDEKGHVEIIRSHFAAMDWEFICVDPFYVELADRFMIGGRSEVLQESVIYG